MKYTTEVIIDKPVETVIGLFDAPDHYEKWMRGLISFDVLEGDFGREGTKSKYVFNMGKRELDMIETVLKRNLPYEYTVKYETGKVFNVVRNSFESIAENKTKYITEHEFHFSGLMKVFAFLMPGSLKKAI